MVILLIWAGMKTWRIYQASTSLLARQAELELMLADGPGNIDVDAAEDFVYGLRSDVASLDNEIGFMTPVLPLLGWLPKIGPLAASAPQLMEMADAGTEAAAYAFRGMKPALLLLQEESNDSSAIPKMLQILELGKTDMAQASLSMDRVVAARDQIDNVDELPWRVRTLLAQADEWLPFGQAGLKMTLVLPDLMGLNGPRRYLIIAQNEDELRATGGFLTGAGLVEVAKGQITKLEFQDANLVDAWGNGWKLNKPYGDPPKALAEVMLLDLFLFRDANFWPDFPISAEKAMDLYSYGQDVPPLDGAIAIDQKFVELLVSGTGPVMIPDTGEIISETNAIASMQDAWTLEDGLHNRKAFLGVFAQAIRNRLENELSGVDPVHLARQISTSLTNKNLQLHVRDPLTSAVLSEVGWDGRLYPPTGHDALMSVDYNAGYNKANKFIVKDMSYHVHLAEDGSAQADLTIIHTHTGEDTGEPCWQGTLQVYQDKGQYQDLTNKCYWNYLRVYVPENSQLISGPRHIVPAETWFGDFDWDRPTEEFTELPGFTTFSNFMLLPRGSEVTSQFVYDLPSTIVKNNGKFQQYQLQLHKQAGAAARPVEIAVTLPEGAQFVSAQPEPDLKERDTIHFTIDLDSDNFITVIYK